MTTPSAAHVSRVLAARHHRSESYSTRVRGYRTRSRGFRVQAAPSMSLVVVNHETGSYGLDDRYAEETAAVERYAATLRAAGYVVEIRTQPEHRHVTAHVTGRTTA